jgi:hypothetical protein
MKRVFKYCGPKSNSSMHPTGISLDAICKIEIFVTRKRKEFWW